MPLSQSMIFEGGEVVKKRSCIGWIWLKDQQRPIVDISQVGRKSLYIVTLGNGQRKRIKGEDIIELKGEEK